MGLFDSIKKLFKKQEEKIEKEKIPFSEVLNLVQDKKKENEVKEQEIFQFIQKKINIFTNQLKEKIEIIENIDIKSKKADDKIKVITIEGRKKYLEALRIFIEKLNNLQKNEFRKFTQGLNNLFINFDKSSYKSYEKATILIGKEMEDIKKEIKHFSKELLDIFNKNKHITEFSAILPSIELKLKKFSEIKSNLNKIIKEIALLDKQINYKKQEIRQIHEDIKRIKETEDYKKNLENIKKVNHLKEDLKQDILNLQQIIDFKSLTNFYHIFENQMEIVKSYRDDFLHEFQKDEGKRILDLINGAKLNNGKVSEKITQIMSKKQIANKNKQQIKEDITKRLYPRVKEIEKEVDSLNSEKSKKEKASKNLIQNKKEVIDLIKKQLGKLNIEITDM